MDEAPHADEAPPALAARLSQAKAQVCSNDHSIVIACDTIVTHKGQVMGKPRDKDEASEMLRRLRGRSHNVYTAVTLLKKAISSTLTDIAETQVVMRAYSDDELTAYVASGDPMDKAGAYAIQHRGFAPVSEVQGCYANVMGLPLCHLTRCLRRWQIEPQRDVPNACQSYIDHCCAVYPSILNSK